MQSRLVSSRSHFMMEFLSDRLNHTRDGSDDAFELRHLKGQLSPARCGQLVVACAAIPSCRTPFCSYPTLDEHSLQRRIQRALLDLKNVIRNPLNRIGDLIPMHLARALQSLQDQKIECSRRNLVAMQVITS